MCAGEIVRTRHKQQFRITDSGQFETSAPRGTQWPGRKNEYPRHPRGAASERGLLLRKQRRGCAANNRCIKSGGPGPPMYLDPLSVLSIAFTFLGFFGVRGPNERFNTPRLAPQTHNTGLLSNTPTLCTSVSESNAKYLAASLLCIRECLALSGRPGSRLAGPAGLSACWGQRLLSTSVWTVTVLFWPTFTGRQSPSFLD